MEKSSLKDVYASAIRASYFNHMAPNKFTNKSKLQVKQIQHDEEVDQNTFRIMRNFKAPQTNFAVIKKQGQVSLQGKGGLFSCFGRKQFHASLYNSVFQVFQADKIKYFYDFSVVNAKVQDRSDKFTITLKTIDKSIDFYPLNNVSTKEWVQVLNQSIQNSDGKNLQKEEISRIPQFYKKKYVSHLDFQKQANTGDIILFRSQHNAARLQQVFLNSQYDHVAIVLRNKKNQLFLYESSSFEGVGLTQWKYMIKYQWYLSTQKIAWKRLKYKLQSHHFDIIQQFIAKTLGKQFSISLDKVFMFQSKMQRNKQEQDSKTYFCSQLVARLYKELGFLDPNVSCTQYYPVTFSSNGNIKFIDSRVSLDNEQVIAF